ncbi:MAG: DUF1592 domain-containing protein, partial [Myxococcota bacterium]
GTDEASCARTFIETIGRHAYRRSLRPEEVEAYVSLFAGADGFFASGAAYEQGVRHVVETVLQSPHFLYRVELSDERDGDALIPLNGTEIASRLSFMLWNTAPDDELLLAAEAGELATVEGVETQARRLLASPRAQQPVDDFHAQWLELSGYENLTKNETQFPDFDTLESADDMQEETRQFIRHVVLELGGDYRDLLTSSITFVNAELAAVYGIEGSFSADEFEQVSLGNDRRGLLTQAGFLASHAYASEPSPIHRGVFLQRQILCNEIPDPPGDIDINLNGAVGDTNRERVANQTADQDCAYCHIPVNEPGFAFEGYDAIGQVRSDDNGLPLDTTGTITLDREEVAFDGALDLIQALADSEDAQRCYLRQWYRYGFAREEAEADVCTITALEEQLRTGTMSIQDMIVAFTRTKTFRFRVPDEGESP